MRITQIDLWHVAIPVRGTFYPAWIPGFPQTENRFTLIRLRTASGLEGHSAGPSIARERQGLGSLLGPYFLGERADDISSIRQRIREMGYLGQKAGWIEPACWDIVGKSRGKALWELLGGSGGKVKLYASTGQMRTGPERVKEVEARLSEGFEAVKLRVHAATLEEDVEQIRKTRAGVGSRPILGVDANQGWRVAVVANAPRWDFQRALAFCKAAEEAGFSWVEEPLPMDDYQGLSRLRAATEVDLAGGELNSHGLPEFGVMLEKGCYDLYQPDAVFCGGVAETWQIIQKVKAAGARYTPHTWTNGVGLAINLQLFAASPFRDETMLEYPYDSPWLPEVRDGILSQPFLHQRGELEVPRGPGLGIEISQRALRRHGHHFFKATKLRVAVSAVLDKGLRTAKEAGAARDARLAARERELAELSTRGEDSALCALRPD
ncbi:MAG: mandelate racemase/muconate lactonizing enzyme family protein [Myxococcales bacterium]|nr:mandelate racemase/muconate lactonizing enzyme family protein [Myxococcales bacterium]